jgi:NADH-quinone oxidoreductase subunit L
MAGVFITAFYSFRMLFLAFHGAPRFDTGAHDHAHADTHGTVADPDRQAHPVAHVDEEPEDDHHHASGPPKESPWVVTVPLILLAIPSFFAGFAYMEPMLFGDFFGNAIVVREPHAVMWKLKDEWHGVAAFVQHGVLSLPFWLAIAGIASAWYCYLVNPALPAAIKARSGALFALLDNKYYFDKFNDWFFAGGSRRIGSALFNFGDRTLIDGVLVNGSARAVGWLSTVLRQLQSGYVYHYAFTMIIGLFALLTWWVIR